MAQKISDTIDATGMRKAVYLEDGREYTSYSQDVSGILKRTKQIKNDGTAKEVGRSVIGGENAVLVGSLPLALVYSYMAEHGYPDTQMEEAIEKMLLDDNYRAFLTA